MILSKEYQDKNTQKPHTTHLGVKLSRQIPLLMHLMAQQVTYHVPLNGEMIQQKYSSFTED